MIGAIVGILLGLAIGMGCRWFDIPLPAPPKLVGALLVVVMTIGFIGTDVFLHSRNHTPVTDVHPEGDDHEQPET
jgi:XapX domain-containing protein